MAVAKQSPNQAASTRDLKHRVLTCLNKLSDRDTLSSASAELESIAKSLSHDSFAPFISSISATDASDKSPVRRQCLRLISLLSESHGDALSPFLSKLLSSVVRRLRDVDSSVRSSCVAATASIASHITKPPFTSILKPLIDALVTEQDQNSQIGAALCLAAAIDASPDPDPLYLRKLLPRLQKLLKSESFKAKPALLTVFGCVIGAGGASSQLMLKNLVPCLVEFVSSDDWAARKAAAEALVRLAMVERDMLSVFKASHLKNFEANRFDKVKIVRDTMNQLVETWKEIPDLSEEGSAPPESQSSSKEDASDGHYPPGTKTSYTVTSGAPPMRKKTIPTSRSPIADGSVMTTARKSSLGSGDKKTGPAMFRKLDRKKPTDRKIQITTPRDHVNVVSDESSMGRHEKVVEKGEERSRFMKPETRRVLFNKNAGSHVVPCHDEISESTVVISNSTENPSRNQRESEDLSLIRKQLVQIENQQSNLLDLLQNFIGSSQNGMRSLETRVHGLEMALDEISCDLAVSTRKMPNNGSERMSCCMLPGADFLSSMFWRREGRLSSSRCSTSGATLSMSTMHSRANRNGNAETFQLGSRRFRSPNGGGLIVNPLAEIHRESCQIVEVSSNRVSQNGQYV